jgi:ArsR family transcriptional regulator, arsenate/arsenite/antimonite-responsive transcriptional repressor
MRFPPLAPPQHGALARPHVVAEPRNLTLEVFKALADPVRLELMAHIAAYGPICVCHLENSLPYRQPRISKHLAVLRRAGLVSSRREGSWVYYSANEQALELARDFLDQLARSMHSPHLADSCEEPA